MSLDAQIAALLKQLPAHVDAADRTVAEHRAGYAELVALRRGTGWAPDPVGSRQDLDVEGVPCVLYRPVGDQPQHVLVYLHGGGWVVGGLDSHEGVARTLCRRTGMAVLAADYRLAPEHGFPAPLEDSLTVTRWAGGQGFVSVSVGGDSAGGCLAAAVALVFRAEGRPLAAQLLVYPALDAAAASASYAQESGYGLEAQDMRWYWDQYAGTHPKDDPLLSPSAAADLRGLAPAVVATVEFDVLRDDGDLYAARLRDAGVRVWSKQYPGLTHGFLGLAPSVVAADVALQEISAALRELVGS